MGLLARASESVLLALAQQVAAHPSPEGEETPGR